MRKTLVLNNAHWRIRKTTGSVCIKLTTKLPRLVKKVRVPADWQLLIGRSHNYKLSQLKIDTPKSCKFWVPAH